MTRRTSGSSFAFSTFARPSTRSASSRSTTRSSDFRKRPCTPWKIFSREIRRSIAELRRRRRVLNLHPALSFPDSRTLSKMPTARTASAIESPGQTSNRSCLAALCRHWDLLPPERSRLRATARHACRESCDPVMGVLPQWPSARRRTRNLPLVPMALTRAPSPWFRSDFLPCAFDAPNSVLLERSCQWI